VLVIINKLSDRTINGELLKYLAKTANDEQPGIRTNTTICLGKIAKNLGTGSRSKVLIAAFTRSLRDPFVHARNASLLALAATNEHFSDEDCAHRILPAICPVLIDKEKLIRDQATKTMDVYLAKIRKAASTMPETVLKPEGATEGNGPRMSTPQPNESSTWAGWAISSFTNKLSTAAGEIQPSASNGTNTPRPASRGPSPLPAASSMASTSSASALHRQAVKSPAATAASTPAASVPPDSFFQDANEDFEDNFGNDGAAWGDMDDMNDDDGGWGETSNNTDSSFAKPSITTPRKDPPRAKPAAAAATMDEGAGEPDFAGWLAAQAGKKAGGSKPLPKGLAKKPATGASAAATKTAPKTKPLVAKKIDLKPKETGDEDDGWGDGW
jgi:SCY1-like protein 1